MKEINVLIETIWALLTIKIKMDIGFRRKWKIDETSKERGDTMKLLRNWTYKQQQNWIKIIISDFMICRINIMNGIISYQMAMVVINNIWL